jgi:hypothetical protein
MGIRFSNSWRGSVVVSAVAAGALLLAGLGGSAALAGDVTANAGDNLSITGATAGVLPQSSSASKESGILSGLHVSGFLSQTFGMW